MRRVPCPSAPPRGNVIDGKDRRSNKSVNSLISRWEIGGRMIGGVRTVAGASSYFQLITISNVLIANVPPRATSVARFLFRSEKERARWAG